MDSKKQDELIHKLKASIQKTIDQQIESCEPPEVNQTIERLLGRGFSMTKIRSMLANLVVKHFHNLVVTQKFDYQYYVSDLLKLPEFEKPKTHSQEDNRLGLL